MSEIYLFPFANINKGSRIAIYGAGVVGQDYMKQLSKINYCSVAFIADEKYANISPVRTSEFKIVSPKEFQKRNDFDYIVIATVNKEYQQEMLNKLLSFGICKDKVVMEDIFLRARDSTYSQHGEDMIIYNAFKHMDFFRNGKFPSYIDVGAHHPYNLSNTALFYQLGCRGINIEANPDLIKEFERERPEDINLCFGIGGEEGEYPFYITDLSGLNTFKKNNLEYNEFLIEHDTGIKEKYPVRKVMNIQVRKLQNVINEYCNGKWPDYMSIDIEGMEFESLSVCDLSNGPALIVVEVNYNGDLFIDMFREKGYFPYLWYRENIIFIKNKYIDMVYAHEDRRRVKSHLYCDK